MSKKELKISVETVSSKTDLYGNRYHYFNAIRLSDGAVAKGRVSSESNSRYLFNKFFDEYGYILFYEKTIPIREFNRNVKNYPYIKESDQEDFQKNITEQWDNNK